VYLNHAKAVAVLCAIAILSGCASPSQIRTDVSKNIDLAFMENRACYAPVQGSPRYRELYNRISLSGKKPTASQLADTDTLTPELTRIYLSWYVATAKCDDNLIEAFTLFAPSLRAKIVSWQTEWVDIERDAIANRRTYGYVNARIESLYSRGEQITRDDIDTETSRRLVEQQRNVDTGLTLFGATVAILVLRQSHQAKAQNNPPPSSSNTQTSQTAGIGINSVKAPLGTTKCNAAANAVQCFLTGAR
jgi:hypothetical protein